MLYFGAGLSVAEPACGPTGRQVADAVRPFVAQMLDIDEDELDGATLEEMAQRVAEEADGRLEELRSLAAKAFNLEGIAPNFGHVAAALLIREGLAQVVSANWDCGVEAAGRRVDVTIAGLVDTAGSVQATAGPHLAKVHGCATRPATIALTQGDIDKPQTWAVSRTQSALTSGTVVFVGLGTPGAYVHEPIEELKKTWISQAANVYVVDPQMSELWQDALGPENASNVHIASSANEFLDELLRAMVRDALDNTELRVRQLARQDQWATTMTSGLAELRKRLRAAAAHSVLRWWRDGVVSSTAGHQFVTELPGQECLMTVAYLAGRDGGEVEVARVSGQQTVASARQYFEIVACPGEHINQVEKVARDRIERRRAEGVYSDVTRPITVVVPQAIGKFPSEAARLDIAAGDEGGADIASGVESIELRFVSAEDGVQGRLAA